MTNVLDWNKEPVSILPKTLRTFQQACYSRGRYDAENWFNKMRELPPLDLEFLSDQEYLTYNSGWTDYITENRKS